MMAHGPIARAGRLGRLALPYLRVLLPGAVDGARLRRAGRIDVVPDHWRGAGQVAGAVRQQDRRARRAAVAGLRPCCCSAAAFWLRVEARAFRRVWESLMIELKPQRSAA